MPIARHPLTRAIWPAIDPVAPAAPGDDHGLARLRPTDVEEAEVRGEPGRSQRAHRERDGYAGRNLRRRPPCGRRQAGIVLPADEPLDQVAHGEVGAARLLDAPHPPGSHDVAEGDRGQVRVSSQPAALRRVERDKEGSHEDFAVAFEPGHGLLDPAKVTVLDHLRGALGEEPPAILPLCHGPKLLARGRDAVNHEAPARALPSRCAATQSIVSRISS